MWISSRHFRSQHIDFFSVSLFTCYYCYQPQPLLLLPCLCWSFDIFFLFICAFGKFVQLVGWMRSCGRWSEAGSRKYRKFLDFGKLFEQCCEFVETFLLSFLNFFKCFKKIHKMLSVLTNAASFNFWCCQFVLKAS